MNGPRRRFAELVHALGNPDEHWPFRPLWLCSGCGVDWPCRPYREHLLATMSVEAIESHMAPYSRFAAIELAGQLPPTAVHARMFDWIREDVPKRRDVRRPPGGPF